VNLQKATAIFDYWFNHSGHWVFGVKGYEKAMQAWKTNGIDGLPKYVW
jgi:hypothetical protein